MKDKEIIELEDKEIIKMVEERDKSDTGARYSSEDVIALREAKKLLEKHGYLIVKPSKNQISENITCNEMAENGEDKDCLECSCNCCLFQV